MTHGHFEQNRLYSVLYYNGYYKENVYNYINFYVEFN